MATVDWPRLTFVARNPRTVLMGATVGGGRSLVGTLQEVSNDSGFWSITLGGVWIRSNAQVKAWRTIEGLLQGRLGTCNVPVFDSKRAPWPNGVPGATIVCTVSGSIAVGATTGVLNMTTGADPEPGMFFSVDERLYRINTVTPNSGDLFTVTFLPGARDAISNGTTVEFAHPICRCRLVTDDGMALALDLQRFAMVDVQFEEDV